MWYKLARFILNYRLPLLIVIVGMTAFLGYEAQFSEVSHSFAKIVPPTNPKFQEYEAFKTKYGDDGNIMVIGVQSDRLFQLDFFNRWYDLGSDLKKINGIDAVVSIAQVYNLVANRQQKKFEIEPIFKHKPTTQAELDSLKEVFFALPFYDQSILNKQTNATLMAVSINKKLMDSQNRISMVKDINKIVEKFAADNHVEVHNSGLPFIRSYKATVISKEVVKFLLYALIVCSIILFFLYRSFSSVIFPVTIVIVGVIWSLGSMVLFHYQITALTGLIPTLLVVIGIPNSVYFLNKYHSEYKKHGNKAKAIARIIEKIGPTLFFTNVTTAIGFGVFVFIRSSMLIEFGIVGGLNIMLTYLISLFLLPIILSYMPNPNTRHTVHLDRKVLNKILDAIDSWTENNKSLLYIITAVVVVVSLVGVMKLQSRGYILDDLPKKNKLNTDLKFFEKNFTGIMPFEILIDTKEKHKVYDLDFLKKVEQAQDTLKANPLFSRSLSLVDALKFSRQAFYNGNARYYALPEVGASSIFTSGNDKLLMTYINNTREESKAVTGLQDTTGQIARITVEIPDIGSSAMPVLLAKLHKQFDTIFDPAKYKVTFTGTSVIAVEGYRYLIDNLISSVLLSFLLNALIIGYEFRSWRMLLLSLIPNIVPLLFTAGLMGYFSITLKPSTVLIFSIAFGMSVDFSIHLLARFKQNFQKHNWVISRTVAVAIREAGVSMIYNCIIILFGFGVFMLSSFNGTVYLGMLVSITLFVSMLANLIILPALILSFGDRLFPKLAAANTGIHADDDDDEEAEVEAIN